MTRLRIRYLSYLYGTSSAVTALEFPSLVPDESKLSPVTSLGNIRGIEEEFEPLYAKA